MNADQRRFDNPATRREFLRGVARRVTAGGLVVGCSLLVLRGGSEASADCVKTIQCGGCDVFGECGLPKAMAAKQTTEVNRG